MIQLEQIQRLQERVLAAVHKIDQLQQENRELRAKAASAEQRAADYREKLEAHAAQYSQIEEGIIHALEHLDALEDAAVQKASSMQAGGTEEATIQVASGHINESSASDDDAESEDAGPDDEPAHESGYYEEEEAPETELDIF